MNRVEETTVPAPRESTFRAEWTACCARLPAKEFFLGALAAWLLLFHFWGTATFGYIDTASLFGWLAGTYRANPDDAHGQLIPFAVAALFWWKRRELVDLPKRVWFPAAGLLFLAVLLHVFGYLVQQGRISTLALVLGGYALIGLFWGWPMMRGSFFPVFLFLFCIPVASLSSMVTVPLRLLVTFISVGFSQSVLGIEVIRHGTEIINLDGTFRYDVAPACSGIRSLITIILLTVIYGFITFKSGWKRLLVVSISLPLAVVGNIIRITGVIIMAEAFGEEIGLKFHDYAGFVTFGLALGGVMLLGHFLGDVPPDPAGKEVFHEG